MKRTKIPIIRGIVTNTKGGCRVAIALGHSQGTQILFRALQKLPMRHAAKLHTIMVGPAKFTDSSAFLSSTNIQHYSDLVSLIADPMGRHRASHGQVNTSWVGELWQSPLASHTFNNTDYQGALKDTVNRIFIKEGIL